MAGTRRVLYPLISIFLCHFFPPVCYMEGVKEVTVFANKTKRLNTGPLGISLLKSFQI
jgi:hypothetical protein